MVSEPRSQAQSDQKTRFSSVANIELCQDDVVKIKNLEVGNVNCHESIFVPIREHVDLTTGVEKTGVSFERVLCRQRRFVVSLEGKARDVVATASEVAESLVEFESKDMSPECGHLRTFRSNPCTSGPSKAYHITVPTSFHAMKKIRVGLYVGGKEYTSGCFDAHSVCDAWGIVFNPPIIKEHI